MRIALCLSGHLRTYNSSMVHQSFIDFKNYLSRFGSIDIFIASWNRQNTKNSWSASHNLNDVNTADCIVDSTLIQKHYETENVWLYNYDYYDDINYSPLKYYYFTNKEYIWDSRGINNEIIHSTKMFYLIYQCNLKKMQYEYNNKFKYDCVFRIRPDHAFDMSQCQQINLENIKSDRLYIPKHNDRFAYGSSDIMNKYSYSIHHMSHFFQQGIFGDPETIQKSCIESVINPDHIVYIPMCGVLVSDTGYIR